MTTLCLEFDRIGLPGSKAILWGQSGPHLQDLEHGETIDWATAEALAFGTLLLEGNHVRNLKRASLGDKHAIIRFSTLLLP